MSATKKQKVKVKKKRTCRTCLLKHKNVTSIFSFDTSLDIGFDVIVSAVTGLEIKTDDQITNYICPACKQVAKSAYLYIEQAKNSEKALLDALKNKTVTGVEDKHTKKPKEGKRKKLANKIEVNIKIEEPVKTEFVDDYFSDRCPSPIDYFGDDFVKKESKYFEIQMDELEHTPKSELRSNRCPVCHECFTDAFALLNHARTHSIKTDVTSIKSEFKTPASLKKKKTVKSTKKSSPKIETFQYPLVPYEEVRPQNEMEYVQDVTDVPRCGICSLLFETRTLLLRHFEKHYRVSVTQCALCDKHYTEPIYLRRHLLVGHSQEEVANSDKMAAVNSTDIGCLIEQRQQRLEPSDSFHLSVCPQCGELLLTTKDLSTHNTSTHPEFQHRCASCFKMFKEANIVSKHGKNCSPLQGYECTICCQKFARQRFLHNHMKQKHTKMSNGKDSGFQCYICNDKWFPKMIQLDKHKFRSHRPKIDDRVIFECDTCHVRSDSKWNLKIHIRTHDNSLPRAPLRYLCRFCGKRMGHSGNLAIHVRRFHTGEKPFKCNYCEKTFVRGLDRNVHERMHTGVKPYACQYCGWRFTRSSALRQHIRVHTGEKPYKCIHCGQGFAQAHDRTKHERRHTGESAYACLCGQAFKTNKDLRAHKETCPHLAPPSDDGIEHMKRQMELARTLLAPSFIGGNI